MQLLSIPREVTLSFISCIRTVPFFLPFITIYYIKLNLSVCLSVCLSACPFVLYTNPQFWADRRETWHEASLGHWAEQGQVGDGAQGEQPAPAGCEPVLVVYKI